MRYIRIRPLLLLLFLLINLVYLTAIVIMIYVNMSRFIVHQESETRQLLLNEVNKQIEVSMRSVEETAINIASHSVLLNALTYESNNSLEDYLQHQDILKMINHFVFTSTNFSSIRIYNDNIALNRMLPFETPFVPLSQYRWTPLDEQEEQGMWLRSHEDPIVFADGTEVLAYVRVLRDNRNKFAGYLKINVKPSYLFSHALDRTGSGARLLVDASGSLVSSITDPGKADEPAAVVESLGAADERAYGHVKLEGDSYMSVYSNPNYIGWKVVETVPHAELFRNLGSIKRFLAIVSLVGLMLSLIISFYLSRTMTKFVSGLLESFRRVETGRFEVPRSTSRVMEIRQLHNGLFNMFKRLNMLLERLEVEHKRKTNAELNAHLAQINPHFLYNTLDAIKWTVTHHGTHEAASMISKLSRLFRISLSRGNRFILLGEELEHGLLYCELQRERYKNNVKLCVRVPARLKLLYVPRIILQPLIENALVHGFNMSKHTPDHPLAIVISASVAGDVLTLSVDNDGNPLQPSSAADAGGVCGGYGFRNVRERIQLYFGAPYGVELRSALPKGVSAVIRMPVIREMDEVEQYTGEDVADSYKERHT